MIEVEAGHRDGQQPARDASLGELVKQLSEHTTRLARLEVELAKAELREKGKQAGMGAGMLGGGGLVALFGLGAFTAAAILGLALVVASWLAAVIVGAAWMVLAAILALVGRRRLARAGRPVPEQATKSVKEDVRWAKTRAVQARQ